MSNDLPTNSEDKLEKQSSRLPIIIFVVSLLSVLCMAAFCGFAVFSSLPDLISSRLANDWPGFPSINNTTALPEPPSDEFSHWDQLIAKDPGNADLYYQRATAYHDSAKQIGSLDVYISKLDRALEDIDTAISLRPDFGDYYSLRQSIYFQKAAEQEYTVDNVYLTSIALDNAYKARELGTAIEEYPERLIVVDLIFSDQCEKALQEVQKQIDELPADGHLGGLLHIRSQAYACLGRLDEALQSLNDSMFNNLNMDYKNDLKVQYLILLERYEEALPILNEKICDCPLGGWNYYLRAEIYYNTGKKDLVQDELDAGMPRTWARGGMLPYVEAQLALDEGRQEDAIRLLQLAEATFNPTYNSLRLKIREQLASLGVQPLNPTLSVSNPGTPIP